MPKRQNPSESNCYAIQVAGRIDPERADWFGALAVTLQVTPGGTPTTVITGEIADQAALFGVLNRIRDLGLKLISVNRMEPGLGNTAAIDAGTPEGG